MGPLTVRRSAVQGIHDDYGIIAVVDGEEHILGEACGLSFDGHSYHVIDAQANAHLWAAAPQLAEVLRKCLKVLIATHPLANMFREQLESGELERRSENIGVKFDLSPRARAALAAKAALALLEE